jgi:uncharacterized protein YbjT (DUF2867 family)
MNLTIFGATGGKCQLLIELALAARHQIVALVCDPSKPTLWQAPAISN